jgi:hypothetical protein
MQHIIRMHVLCLHNAHPRLIDVEAYKFSHVLVKLEVKACLHHAQHMYHICCPQVGLTASTQTYALPLLLLLLLLLLSKMCLVC